MAFADPAHDASEVDLKALRRDIGQLLFNTPGQEKAKTIGLRESFAIWQLDANHLSSASPCMPGKPSALWHYQVYLDGSPRAHALVQRIDGRFRIRSIEASGLAQRIDQAIDWIDTQDKDRTPVHYLVASCCRVQAFQLVDNDVVYIVAAPPAPPGVPEEKQLHPETIVSTTEFLARLRGLYDKFTSRRRLKEEY